MTTITRERLLTIRQWRETYGPGSNVVLPAEEAEELARIALASIEAEPVAWKWRLTSLLTVCKLARGGCVLRHYHPARGWVQDRSYSTLHRPASTGGTCCIT